MRKIYSEDRSVSFVTLGCKVNQTESEAMAQLFRDAGYQIVDRTEQAGVVVVNTCTVTNTGDAKSRQMIRRMIKAHPDSFVVVTGCYAQTSPGEVINIDGVDLVLGTQDRTEILQWIDQIKELHQPQNRVREIGQKAEFEELPQLEGESRTRAMLKVQEGCDQFCTYCIIPYARGPVRSRAVENSLAEARRLISAGYKEIVLTGIHLGAYGKDLAGRSWDIARLVSEIEQIPGLVRLRLGSLEPMEITDDLITLISRSSVICPHLHIPLQSGSDEVLSRMNRPYTLKQYKALLDKLHERIPELAVTTDVIAGFPGEKEEDHEKALHFVQECGFAGIHAFPYSRRRGTSAADYPDQLPKAVKEKRVGDLLSVAQKSKGNYRKQFLDRAMEVLIEKTDEQGGYGHTRNYLEVYLPFVEVGACEAGQICTTVLKENYFL